MTDYSFSTAAKIFLHILFWVFIIFGIYGNAITTFTIDILNISKNVEPYKLFYSIYIFMTFILGAVVVTDTIYNILLKIIKS